MGISAYIRSLRAKIGNDLLLLPAISAIILNERREVLLQRAADDGKWYTIGGVMEPGEEPADACVREVKEEAGLDVEPVRVISVASAPSVTYKNGHQVQYVTIAFLCRVVGGVLAVSDDESLEFRYFAADDLPDLNEEQRQRIFDALAGRAEASFIRRGHTGDGGFDRPS